MSNQSKQLRPVLEDSQKYKDVRHVSVQKTVNALLEKLKQQGDRVELVMRQGEINRVGMVVKQVEEASNVEIKRMHTEYSTEKKGERDINVTSFRVVFVRK